MSDDITYEFVKGQGWVPKKKGPAWDVEKVLEEWVKLEHQFLIERYDENPIDNYWLRRRQLTIQEFERQLTRDVTDYETRLHYRLRTGEMLAMRVVHDPLAHPEDYYMEDYNRMQISRAIRDMYREAERRGF